MRRLPPPALPFFFCAPYRPLLLSHRPSRTSSRCLCAGRLRQTRLRSVYWRVFLELLPAGSSPQSWAGLLEARRTSYAELLVAHRTDPSKAQDDPLSLAEDSAWGRFYKVCSWEPPLFWVPYQHALLPRARIPSVSALPPGLAHLPYPQETELLDEIKKDLDRLYPDGCGDFFEKQPIKDAMLNILYLWSSMNPETSYRQGMHEVLAPIVYQLESDKYAEAGQPVVESSVDKGAPMNEEDGEDDGEGAEDESGEDASGSNSTHDDGDAAPPSAEVSV